MVVVQLLTYSVPLLWSTACSPLQNLRICFLALPSVGPTLSTNPLWFIPQFHSHRSFLMVSTVFAASVIFLFPDLEITKAEIFSKIHCLALISKVLTERLKGLSSYQTCFHELRSSRFSHRQVPFAEDQNSPAGVDLSSALATKCVWWVEFSVKVHTQRERLITRHAKMIKDNAILRVDNSICSLTLP